MKYFFWALSNGSRQEFGFVLEGKWPAMERRWVIKQYAMLHCEPAV